MVCFPISRTFRPFVETLLHEIGSAVSAPQARTLFPAGKKFSRQAEVRCAKARLKLQTTRPLLVVDGDSFAHRAYHALPKTIRRTGNRGGGAILGFANFLLKFYQSENPRAVLVGWDTLDEPTYRHEALETYQAGREFDDELVEQLDALPAFVSACGFANGKAAGYEADDFLAAAVAREEKRGGTAVVATGDRDAFQLASARTTILQPVKAGELARIGPAQVMGRYGLSPGRFLITSRCAAMRPTGFRVLPELDQRALPISCASMAHRTTCWRPGVLRRRPRNCASTVPLRRWTSGRHCRLYAIKVDMGARGSACEGMGIEATRRAS